MPTTADRESIRIKVFTIGDTASGKTCLIKQFYEKRFSTKYQPTVGVDYGAMRTTILNREVKMHIFDLSGDALFRDTRNEFYQHMDGAILVFDVTSRISFQSLNKWILEVQTELMKSHKNLSNTSTVVCGNKVDRSPRVITYLEASDWCAKRNLSYFETSAATGHGVFELFSTLLEVIVDSNPPTCSLLDDQLGMNWHQFTGRNASPLRTFPTEPKEAHHGRSTEHHHDHRHHRHDPPFPRTTVAPQMADTGKPSGPKGASEVQNSRTIGCTKAQRKIVTQIRNAKTSHERLCVGIFATREEINRSYRRLAFAVHPDKNFAPGSEDAFKLLTEARDALLQTHQRLSSNLPY